MDERESEYETGEITVANSRSWSKPQTAMAAGNGEASERRRATRESHGASTSWVRFPMRLTLASCLEHGGGTCMTFHGVPGIDDERGPSRELIQIEGFVMGGNHHGILAADDRFIPK